MKKNMNKSTSSKSTAIDYGYYDCLLRLLVDTEDKALATLRGAWAGDDRYHLLPPELKVKKVALRGSTIININNHHVGVGAASAVEVESLAATSSTSSIPTTPTSTASVTAAAVLAQNPLLDNLETITAVAIRMIQLMEDLVIRSGSSASSVNGRDYEEEDARGGTMASLHTTTSNGIAMGCDVHHHHHHLGQKERAAAGMEGQQKAAAEMDPRQAVEDGEAMLQQRLLEQRESSARMDVVAKMLQSSWRLAAAVATFPSSLALQYNDDDDEDEEEIFELQQIQERARQAVSNQKLKLKLPEIAPPPRHSSGRQRSHTDGEVVHEHQDPRHEHQRYKEEQEEQIIIVVGNDKEGLLRQQQIVAEEEVQEFYVQQQEQEEEHHHLPGKYQPVARRRSESRKGRENRRTAAAEVDEGAYDVDDDFEAMEQAAATYEQQRHADPTTRSINNDHHRQEYVDDTHSASHHYPAVDKSPSRQQQHSPSSKRANSIPIIDESLVSSVDVSYVSSTGGGVDVELQHRRHAQGGRREGGIITAGSSSGGAGAVGGRDSKDPSAMSTSSIDVSCVSVHEDERSNSSSVDDDAICEGEELDNDHEVNEHVGGKYDRRNANQVPSNQTMEESMEAHQRMHPVPRPSLPNPQNKHPQQYTHHSQKVSPEQADSVSGVSNQARFGGSQSNEFAASRSPPSPPYRDPSPGDLLGKDHQSQLHSKQSNKRTIYFGFDLAEFYGSSGEGRFYSSNNSPSRKKAQKGGVSGVNENDDDDDQPILQVMAVQPYGPAASGGIIVGDVLCAVNGLPVTSHTALDRVVIHGLEKQKSGTPCTMTLMRGAGETIYATFIPENDADGDGIFRHNDSPQRRQVHRSQDGHSPKSGDNNSHNSQMMSTTPAGHAKFSNVSPPRGHGQTSTMHFASEHNQGAELFDNLARRETSLTPSSPTGESNPHPVVQPHVGFPARGTRSPPRQPHQQRRHSEHPTEHNERQEQRSKQKQEHPSLLGHLQQALHVLQERSSQSPDNSSAAVGGVSTIVSNSTLNGSSSFLMEREHHHQQQQVGNSPLPVPRAMPRYTPKPMPREDEVARQPQPRSTVAASQQEVPVASTGGGATPRSRRASPTTGPQRQRTPTRGTQHQQQQPLPSQPTPKARISMWDRLHMGLASGPPTPSSTNKQSTTPLRQPSPRAKVVRNASPSPTTPLRRQSPGGEMPSSHHHYQQQSQSGVASGPSPSRRPSPQPFKAGLATQRNVVLGVAEKQRTTPDRHQQQQQSERLRPATSTSSEQHQRNTSPHHRGAPPSPSSRQQMMSTGGSRPSPLRRDGGSVFVDNTSMLRNPSPGKKAIWK